MKTTKIVLVGGGFAGLSAAMHLDKTLARRADIEVTLISRESLALPAQVHTVFAQPQRGRNISFLFSQFEIQRFMNLKRRSIGGNSNGCCELRSQLADILTYRAQGLLTQKEYEERLEQVEQSLPEKGCLQEHDLPRGGTRFVLREAASGRVLGEFEFHRGHEVDR